MLHRQNFGDQQDILQTIDHGRCQHIIEEVWGQGGGWQAWLVCLNGHYHHGTGLGEDVE